MVGVLVYSVLGFFRWIVNICVNCIIFCYGWIVECIDCGRCVYGFGRWMDIDCVDCVYFICGVVGVVVFCIL